MENNVLKNSISLHRLQKGRQSIKVLQIFKSKRKMKKLVFLFVAFAAVSFASCGNKAANSENASDSASVEATVVEEAAPVAGDSLNAAADSTDSTSTVVAE